VKTTTRQRIAHPGRNAATPTAARRLVGRRRGMRRAGPPAGPLITRPRLGTVAAAMQAAYMAVAVSQ
jgi:hypothetical protein